MDHPHPHPRTRAAHTATLATFAAFGAFWGSWGASIPRIRDQAGVSEGELGIALLCIGAGALPAMLATGRAVDRFGLRTCAPIAVAFGLLSIVVPLAATSFVALAVGLVLLGMSSGATDVAMNAVAGRVEHVGDRPVISHAHGVLSAFVVLGSLVTAAVAAADLPLVLPFVGVAALALVAATLLLRGLAAGPVATTAADGDSGATSGRGIRGGAAAPLALVGLLGALAFATESGHQNWSALFASDVLNAGAGGAALAPAWFATIVAIARLTTGGIGARHPRGVLLAGGTLATAGTLLVSAAAGPLAFALGLALAGAGTGVLFPTVLGIVARTVVEWRRGRATSFVTTVSYLGFLLGPAYVGAWADAFDLRISMVAVAGLAAVLVVLTVPLLRLADAPAG